MGKVQSAPVTLFASTSAVCCYPPTVAERHGFVVFSLVTSVCTQQPCPVQGASFTVGELHFQEKVLFVLFPSPFVSTFSMSAISSTKVASCLPVVFFSNRRFVSDGDGTDEA